MIDITKDKKSKTYVITKTDNEGFHHQLHLTFVELSELTRKAIKVCFNKN